MNIRQYLNEHDDLFLASGFDPEDATLSSGERALANITYALANHADNVDAGQLNALVDALSAYRDEVQNQEHAAWQIINSRRNPS